MSSEPSVLRLGAWEIRVQAPAKVSRALRAVLSPIAIPEQHLPALEVLVSDGVARGTIDGTEAWTVPVHGRGWLSALVGYAVGTATSLLQELLFIHAAAVEIAGRGYVLVGSPGSGKTSAAAVLLRRGGAYLSDEVALLDPRAGILHPFCLPLAVKPWTARAIGALPPVHLVASEGDIRYQLPVRRAQGPVPLEAMVLLDPTHPAVAPVEVSRAEMLLALSGQPSSFRYRPRLEAAFAGFVHLLRRARCLRLGSATPADAARVLASLAERRGATP